MYNLDLFADKWENNLDFRVEILTDYPPPPALFEGQTSSNNPGAWIKFIRSDGIRPFYIWYVLSNLGNAPLLLFLPGADGAIHSLPYCEYDCITASPLGYGLPDGSTLRNRPNLWYTTMMGKQENYSDYIQDALCILKWALREKPDRKVILAGNSQGGGIALILSAILKGRVTAVCADEPMFIGFSGLRISEVLEAVSTDPYTVFSRSQIALNLAFIDPLRFPERLTMPVLLSLGEQDPYCPSEINNLLFEALPNQSSRSISIPRRSHGYDPSFFQAMTDFLADLCG